MRMQTRKTASKVKAAALAGAIAGGGIYASVNPPVDLDGIIETVVAAAVSALLTWIAGYFKKPSKQDQVVKE